MTGDPLDPVAQEIQPEIRPEAEPEVGPGIEAPNPGPGRPIVARGLGAAALDEDAPADRGTRRERLAQWWGAEQPDTPRERARTRAIRRGTVAGAALILIASLLKLPLLILSPGPTYNTIGEVNGQPMIVISGTKTYPTEGVLDMTTVAERGGSSGGVHLGEALAGWVASTSRVVPRETLYGPDTSGEDVAARNDQLFALSQSDSIAAAMDELDIPTEQTVVVTMVGGGTPADTIVQAGDVIVAVDGTKVTQPSQVSEAVQATEVGDTVTLDVRRRTDSGDYEDVTLKVVTAPNPDVAAADPDADPVPYLGIGVGIQHEAPFDIDFTLENVGGPSAGMMFSLAMVDMLTPGSLTAGGHVAGTGTIDPEGTVGPIGGIEQKLQGASASGATLFLAPVENCDGVVGNEPDGMRVVPVTTLSEARDVVETWAQDNDAPFTTCEAVLSGGADG